MGRADIHHFEAFKITPKKIDTLILSGDGIPFTQRPIKIADLSFPIELKPFERASIVIMIEKRGEELNMHFFLQEEQKFYASVQKDYNFIFFYLGILFIIFLFNFFLWINLKDNIHLIYIGIVFSNALFVLSLSGLGFQYIWSNFVYKNSLIGIFVTALHFSLVIFFALRFLNMKVKSIFYNFSYYYAWFLLLILIPISLVPMGTDGISITSIIFLRKIYVSILSFNILLLIAIIIEQFLKRNPYVLIYSISVSIPIIGGILYSLSISGSDFWIRPVYVIYISNLFELIVLTYGLTIRYNKFKKVNSILALNLVKLKNQVSEKIIQTQETERRRLAQDLHDDLAGTLSAIKGRMSNEAVHLETIHLVEKAIDDLRLVSRDLMPPELANEGLVKAILHTIERLQNASKIEFTYIPFGKEIRLSEEKELNIYRIMAELLNNVVKHSKATKAIIQLIYYEKYLFISLEDNGIGINTNENTWGIGLKNINSRVEFMKAKIVTDSSIKGATFIIEVPYS